MQLSMVFFISTMMFKMNLLKNFDLNSLMLKIKKAQYHCMKKKL